MKTNDKRHHSIRNKLFAAIAMLLVSSIMMVSTTYAWFTLSTAPEVQGITTTVGANGNLEIALSPYSGDANDITSAVGDSLSDWLVKNLTWGNMLNLSDAAYNLGDIKLMPARLNAQGGILQPSPLMTPVYGADGRVERLEATSQIGTKLMLNGTSVVAGESFAVNNYKGVRAIGTSSTMSKYAITFNNYLSAMGTNMTNAQNLAKASLTANGSKLAGMAISHAVVEGVDNNDYAAYVPYMDAVITALKASSAEIEKALFAAVVAAGASGLSSAEDYEALMTLVENPATTLEQLVTLLNLDATNPLMVAYTAWQNVESDLDNATSALAAAKTKADSDEDVLWTDASPALGYLLTSDGITLNGGKNLTAFKEMASLYLGGAPVKDAEETDEEFAARQEAYTNAVTYIGGCISNMQITLGNGSGIYANIAELVGNLSASVTIDINYPGFPVPLVGIPVTLSTNAGFNYLTLARTALYGEGALEVDGQATTAVLNDIYAYMVDFFFRTNASGSKLMLQTSAAQRIYGDSSSEATLGGGSTMSFRTGAMDAQAVQNLMGAIRVVFLDTATQAIYGYAKLDMTSVRETVITAAVGNTPAVLEYTADLYLYTSNDDNATKIDEANAELCDLPANTAKAVSAMVYLSGDHVTNADVANAETSMTGSLNLQFASSAELKPMENSALENMTVPSQTTN